MNKKMYETLKNINEGDLDNYLENTVKQCYLDSYLEGCLDGFCYTFGIDENGEFYHYRSSANSMTVGEMHGSQFVLGVMNANNSYYDNFCNSGTLVDVEFLNQLSLEEEKDLLEQLLTYDVIQELKDEVLEDGEDFSLICCYNNYTYLVIEVCEEMFSEKINELIKEDLEGYCWDIEKDNLMDRFLRNIEDGIRYYEEVESIEE